jgi:hypothetical protein
MTKEEFIDYFKKLPSEYKSYYGDDDGCFEYRFGGDYVKDKFVCVDGFSVSVQNHNFSYSSYGDYKQDCYYGDDANEEVMFGSFELGLPSKEDALIEPYKYEPEIYKYVPLNIVVDLINKHRGIEITQIN